VATANTARIEMSGFATPVSD